VVNHRGYVQSFFHRTGILIPQFFTGITPEAVNEAGKQSEIRFFP
jgi:hypothetical protein